MLSSRWPSWPQFSDEEQGAVTRVLASGKVIRSNVAEVPAKGRDTMGVVFAKFADEDRIISIAKNIERNLVAEEIVVGETDGTPESDSGKVESPNE